MPAPTSSSPTSLIVDPGYFDINGTAISALTDVRQWGLKPSTGVNLTYSFPWANSSSAIFSTNYSTLNEAGAAYINHGFSAIQQTSTRYALQEWSNVSNLVFSEVTDTSSNVGDLRFGITSARDTTSTGNTSWGWAYFPSSRPQGGDVWISTASSGYTDTDWSIGSYNFYSLIHETGHALGLKHPWEGAPTLDDAHNTRQFTVMAYNHHPHSLFVKITHDTNGSSTWESHNVIPETPMLYDIAAIQMLYGINTSFHSNNDTYTFDPNTPFFKTIWDAGGNDTISVSNFNKACTIDLEAGHFSKITIESDSDSSINWNTAPPTATYDGTDNLAIAYNCNIENAVGGLSNDTLIGNQLPNYLQGGAGNDTISGAAGNDTLEGGLGNDRLEGDAGTNTAIYSASIKNYHISHTNSQYYINNLIDTHDQDTLISIQRLEFKDMAVNLTIQDTASLVNSSDLIRLEELYVAFFNRIPDADGLEYWINQFHNGSSINSIANSFYSAGIQFTSLTGFSGSMSNTDFINKIYQNVLGRSDGADTEGLNYWNNELSKGTERGTLVSTILNAAHTFKGNTTWGWVADLLDNKIVVANNFAVTMGLNYNSANDSITHGMAIAAAVTPTSTTAAINLIGVNSSQIDLM
jgi:Ca2+-binding RTX toxin-like protein